MFKYWQPYFAPADAGGGGGDPKPEEVRSAEPPVAGDDDDDELASLAVDDGKGNKVVPLSALMGVKKENRALSKKVKELEPVAQRVTEIDGRLEKAMPIVNAVLNDPRLRAAALKAAGMTRPSADDTRQPDDDPDAQAEAEDRAWYLPDGVTVDVARGRRALDRMTKVARASAEEVVRPFAGLAVGSKAEQNITRAMAAQDKDGVPYATEESIKEIAKELPQNLLASPEVVELLLRTAIGQDRLKGRTPKPPEEPLYLEAPGGRRGAGGESVITGEERGMLRRVGVSDKEYQETLKKLENTPPGKAVRLG